MVQTNRDRIPGRSAPWRTALVLVAVVGALAAGACDPKSTPVASGTTSTPTPVVTTPPPGKSTSFCDIVIEINTSAGYMVNKTFNKQVTATQLKQIVDQVILRESEIVAAATAAGLANPYHVVLRFYHGLHDAAATDPNIYADYLAGQPAAAQTIAAAVGDVADFRAKQLQLANYEKTTCGITFPPAS
jgi:hypothetical protein